MRSHRSNARSPTHTFLHVTPRTRSWHLCIHRRLITPRGTVRHVSCPVNRISAERGMSKTMRQYCDPAICFAPYSEAITLCRRHIQESASSTPTWLPRRPASRIPGTSCCSLARCQTSHNPEEVDTAPVACVPVRPPGTRRPEPDLSRGISWWSDWLPYVCCKGGSGCAVSEGRKQSSRHCAERPGPRRNMQRQPIFSPDTTSSICDAIRSDARLRVIADEKHRPLA